MACFPWQFYLFGHLELRFSGSLVLNALFVLAINCWGPGVARMAPLLRIQV